MAKTRVDTRIDISKTVEFKLNAPNAKEVMLAGDFNNWDYSATPLRKAKGAEWRRNLTLKPGRYEYKFVVDGNWITDPANNNKVGNTLGSENSILEV